MAVAASGPARASVPADTAALADSVSAAWVAQQDPLGRFPNPSAAELAAGKSAFAPPMLMHGLLNTGRRTGQTAFEDAAQRAWGTAVSPARASAFDMLGAAMTYRQLEPESGLGQVVADYLRQYGVTTNGGACIVTPDCYHNLKLVDAAAVLVMTGTGLSSDIAGTRLNDPAAARAQAAAVINQQIPSVVDHRLAARSLGLPSAGSVLSDSTQSNPLAYHALSTYMLAEAVQELGPEASPAARQTLIEALDALAVLMAPDGDISYMGRGQGQVWVPALAAAAAAHGARFYVDSDPERSARMLAVVERAVSRLRTRHLIPDGRLAVVPGQRSTTDGIDRYANSIAYNGLALYGITRAAELLEPLGDRPPGPLPADGELTVADPGAGRLGISARDDVWLAVRTGRDRQDDLRYGFGLLALQARRADGWHDLVGPRPLTRAPGLYAGPSLLSDGRPARPEGRGVRIRDDGTVTTRLLQRSPRGRLLRRLGYSAQPVTAGARFKLEGVRRGEIYQTMVFVPADTGRWNDAIRTDDAVIRFDGRVRVHRVEGYHSGPVENLDALVATVRVLRSGTLAWTITGR